MIKHPFMESIQFKLTTFHESSACIYNILKRFDVHINTWIFQIQKEFFQSIFCITFQKFTSSFFNLLSQDYLFILSHHSSLINLEQSMIFVSCELLSLEGKINHIDTCSRNHSTQNSTCIHILFSELLRIRSLFSILVFQDCWKQESH